MKISIRNKLEENNMTRYELAKRIDVTYPTIDNIYKEESTSIKFETLESICRELNCSLDDILVFDDKDLRDKQLKRMLAYTTLLKNQSDTK